MNKRKTSPAASLIELFAVLPWWVGATMAIVSYLLLHRVATQSVAPANQPGQIGTMVTHMMWQSLAKIGQYLLPLICLIGSAISVWRRKVRKDLVVDAAQGTATSALDGMSWQKFEMLVGESFRQQGYQVTETGGGGPDGGVDLTLAKGGEKFLVQCKQWRALKVGVDVVRELYGVMAARGATGGFVVTSGRFTNDAVQFASGRNVNLIDGTALHTMLKQASSATASRAPQRPSESASKALRKSPTAVTPACPVCQKDMVRRTAKRGANVGGEFWGCVDYPGCRGTRQAS
jgi:restriction system protein